MGRLRAIARAWGITAFVLLSIAPLAVGLLYAAAYSVELTGLLASGFTLEHWHEALSSAETWRSVGLSAAVAAATVALAGAAALALALAVGERLDRPVESVAVHIPLAIPGTVAALLATQLLSGTGWWPRLAWHLGWPDALDGRLAAVNDRYAIGIVLTETFLITPFLTLTFRALFTSERLADLSGVAASLGATPGQILGKIVLPILLKQGLPTLVLVFVVLLGAYEIPLLLGRQSPQMLSVLIMRKYGRFDLGDKPEALAVALLYAAAVTVVVTVAFRPPREPA